MAAALAPYQAHGITLNVFGDLYLEDIRAFREAKLAPIGMRAAFPLWGLPTDQVAERFIALGFRAILTCVDTQQLAVDFVGRDYDRHLLADLPEGVDPCGENGEFHTFVTAGPILARPVAVKRGDVVLRDGRFAYCDLLPVR
jgi:diphthamide synthase (EF-2-diphthine--ammonia ligase)